MSTATWDLPGARGEPIFGDTHLPGSEPRGTLIICHGFKGYKDYGFFPRLAATAAQRGLIAHRFNFSHSGMTRRIDTFERPDLFERDTWGRQIFDLKQVAEAVAAGELPGYAEAPVQARRQAWFGHSRGGVTVILTAGEMFTDPDPALERGRPAAVIAAATPHTGDRLDDEQKATLRKLGKLASPSSRTGQTLHLGVDWLDEFEADPDRYDPIRQIGRLRCPILLIHGDDDATVHLMSSKQLNNAARDQATLRIVSDATHTFNAPNPLDADAPLPPQTEALIDATCDFAIRSL